LWVIFLYCVLSLLTEGLFAWTNLPIIFWGFNIVQFALFSYFTYSSLKQKKLRYVPIIGAILFLAVTVSNLVSKKFDSLAVSFAWILIIPYCILLLYEQIRDPNTVFVYHSKKFWVIIAFFLYFSATLFLYISANTLSAEQRSSYWVINNFFEILKNILFCISFIMKKRPNNPYAVEGIDS
jgi:hypothetical protein